MKISKFALIFTLTLFTTLIYSQWNQNISINTPVAIVAKAQQNNHSVSDLKNGVIIGWDDNRNSSIGSTDIYAQRLNSQGVPKWTINGVPVCTNTNTQRSVAMIADGFGGTILTWEDNRSGNYDIYAQKIDSNGLAQWTPDGVVITSSPTNQKGPKIVTDNAGGAIIVWEDSVNSYNDIYAQRISITGSVMWATNGVSVCAAVNEQNNPKIDIDGSGGAIITWQDKRNALDYDIYAQHLDGNGISQWATNGIPVCNSINTQNNPRIEPDGANGAIIAWIDKRFGIDYDIYAQRVNSAGVIQWAANGVAVCNAPNNQSALDIKYLGSNGVSLSWKDQRTGSIDIYVQILSLSGSNLMAVNGVKISNALQSLNPNNIADGSGGVIIAWQDSTSAGWNITSQKINTSGNILWTPGGATVCNAADDQINVSQVSDGSGGAIYVWEDHRNTVDYDMYAQHLDTNGNAVGIHEVSGNKFSLSLYPNPAAHFIQIKKDQNKSGNLEVRIYNAFGCPVKQVMLTEEVTKIDLTEMTSGIYHYSVLNKAENEIHNGSFIIEK